MPDYSKKNQFVLSTAINQKYYPSLNGIRGISIIIVILSHFHLSGNIIYSYIFNGSLGVNIFFVLSGFLITTLCIKEQNLTGNLSLKEFYIRRILRIFPVAYLYIAVIFILNFIFHLGVAKLQFLGSLFYLMNLSYFKNIPNPWLTGHYWSLSIEEQFYIIFPFVLKKSFKVFFYSIVFLVAVLPLLYTLQEFYGPLRNGILYAFIRYFIMFQPIATGCLFSLLSFKKVFDHTWLSSTKVMGNVLAIFLIIFLKHDPYIYWATHVVYVNLLISVLTGYIIVSNIMPAKDFIYRILNTKILSSIGILSYSIYIWQEIFTSQDMRLPKYMVAFPYNLLFILIVPLLSYFFYEKYFLKLKSKFSKLQESKRISTI